MRQNGERRPEEIEAEIERTRADMDATLSAIENRLTPGQLVDQGLSYLRHSGGNEFVSNLGSSVKQNPLPVTLVGLGVAWLMMTGRSSAPPRTETHGASWGERSREAKERVSGAATAASERIGGTARAARDSVTHAASAARERASHLGATTQRQWERARGTYDHLLQEQPLVLGAAGLAVGALLAATLPRTRQEEAMLGHASGREAGRAAGEEAVAHSRTASGATVDTAARQSESAPGHEMLAESDRVACPATDAPVEQPIRRTSPGMDV